MKGVRTAAVLMVCCLLVTACHRFETVNDLSAVASVRGKLSLSPEGRANNARRLGGVAMEITGVVFPVVGDSIGIKADDVRFADLGTVPFGQGELRFAARDISLVAREVPDRKKTMIAGLLTLLGVVAVGIAFAPGDGIFGLGRSDPPIAR